MDGAQLAAPDPWAVAQLSFAYLWEVTEIYLWKYVNTCLILKGY